MDFPFGPWEPDRGETSPGRSFIADSVIPQAEGYGPMPSLVVSAGAEALPDVPRGVYSLTDNTGLWKVFAATASDIYTMNNDYSFTSIGTGYAVPAGDDWSMIKFGSKLLYTNVFDGLQAYDVDAGGSPSAVTAAKNPRQVFICGNQVVGLDCLDSNGDRNNRLIRTSAFSDHTNWTTDGADYQPLEDGGALIAGGAISETAAVIYQDRAIRLMDYSSPSGNALYSLRLIAPETGSIGARSVVFADGRAFSIATDGPYMFSLGGGLVPIGVERVNRWFLNLVDQGNFALAQAAVDPLHKIVWWRFKRAADISTVVSEVMIGYAWQIDRWVSATVQTSYLSNSATPGYTTDDADSLGPLDSIDTPLDSRFWQGGQPLFGGLDDSFKFGVFAGGAMAATLQTSTANSPVTGLIGFATPVDDAANGMLSLGVKDQISDTLTWKTAAAKGRGGRVPLRGRGINIAFEYSIAANEAWTVAKGIDHVVAANGGST